jgi:hypothetical protein
MNTVRFWAMLRPITALALALKGEINGTEGLFYASYL